MLTVQMLNTVTDKGQCILLNYLLKQELLICVLFLCFLTDGKVDDRQVIK